MSHRTIIIGDVHGCAEELEALLDRCAHTASDEVILAGDLVAKGPDSRRVVQRARALGARSVKGNHDEHVLRWYRASPTQRQQHSLQPTHRQVVETLEEDDWAYLAAMPNWIRLSEHRALVVHAGLVPGVPLKAQREEDLLNLRSITKEGAASKKVDGGAPWASLWKGPELVVFGHDAIRGLQQHPFAIGLDTGCCYGRALTALLLPGRELISVPARKA